MCTATLDLLAAERRWQLDSRYSRSAYYVIVAVTNTARALDHFDISLGTVARDSPSICIYTFDIDNDTMPGFGASSPPAAPPAAPTAIATDHADPKVAELHTMFPTVETSVIEIILESVGGSQDRAIEQLLSMTDENFKVEAGSTARREAEVRDYQRVHFGGRRVCLQRG
jgi:hypothetical protein